jgi:hypothetical protein
MSHRADLTRAADEWSLGCVHFFVDLWRSAKRPQILRRTAVIALSVGTILTTINLGDVIMAGAIDARIQLKIAMNYVVPFVVSNLGAMSATTSRPS